VSSIRPQWKEAEEDYKTLECRADVSGTLPAIAHFLYQVERDPLGVKVDSLELTKELAKSGAGYAVLPPVAFKDEAQSGELISAGVIEPELVQGVHYAVQAHWRIPRSIYNKFHRAFYEVWMDAVDKGEWPAKWVFDRDEIAQSFG